MADFETIYDAKNDLVRAHLHFAILVDDIDNECPETLEDDTTGDLDLPVTAQSLGVIEKQAGVSVTHNMEQTDVEGYGDAEPVRTIISKRVVEFQANFLETNRRVLELFWGTDFVEGEDFEVSERGGVTLKTPSKPKDIHYRAYLVTEDDVNGEELYAYYIMPRVKLVNVETQESADDNAVSYNMTFRATKDRELGFAVLQGWCGPGWLRLVDKTGFVAPVTAITATADETEIDISDAEDAQITVTGSNGLNYTPLAKFSVTTGPTIVKVSKTGLVEPLAAGSAVVTAKYAGKTSTVSFTVTA